MSSTVFDAEKHAERQVQLLQTMTVRKEDGWLKGAIARYEFFAKVFPEGSKYGINGGRVSKLTVRRKPNHLTDEPVILVNYDRGWDIRPEDDQSKLILDALVEYFENLPADAIKEGC